MQETFAKLWRGAARFDPERGTETTFVFTVARRAAVDQWRRGRRAADDRPLDHLPESAGAVTTGPGAPEAHVESVVTGWAVIDALDALPAAQREVIDLAYYGQLSQREIADRLGIPLGTVKTTNVQRTQDPASRDDHERGDGMTDDLDLTEDHERIRVDLGGYVLGSLTLDEQQAVEAHLEACSACRAELAELEGIPVLLELARPRRGRAASARSSGPSHRPLATRRSAVTPIARARLVAPQPGAGGRGRACWPSPPPWSSAC